MRDPSLATRQLKGSQQARNRVNVADSARWARWVDRPSMNTMKYLQQKKGSYTENTDTTSQKTEINVCRDWCSHNNHTQKCKPRGRHSRHAGLRRRWDFCRCAGLRTMLGFLAMCRIDENDAGISDDVQNWWCSGSDNKQVLTRGRHSIYQAEISARFLLLWRRTSNARLRQGSKYVKTKPLWPESDSL